MEKTAIQADKFLIYDPDKSQSTGNVFIAHPTPVEQETFGNLMIITDIQSQDRINQDIINTIQQEVKKHYYQSSDLNIETAFENALQKTNEKLHQLIEDGLADWVDKLNIIIAVIKGSELHFTQVGNMQAYLIQGSKIVDILNASNTPAELEINPLKIFSNIISGKLNEGDYLLFCTGSLLDFISLEKMKKTITGSRPQDAAAYIENLLIDTDQKTTFAALIAQLVPSAQAQKEYMPLNLGHSQYSAPQVSMEEMQSREKQTSELLTPSLLPLFKKGIAQFSERTKKLLNRQPASRQDKPYPERVKPTGGNELPEKDKTTSQNLLSGLGNIVKIIFVSLGKGFLALFNLVRDWRQSKQKVKNWPDRLAQSISTGIEKFISLPASRKALLAAAVILIFAFAQSIVTLGEGQEKEKQTEEYSQLISQIQQKQEEIDAALIYENNQEAVTLLRETRELVAQLPEKKYQEQINQFNQDLQQQSDKINKVVVIDSPEPLFDYATLEEGSTVRGIAQVGSRLFSFNPNNNSIYTYNTETQATDLVSGSDQEIGNLQMKALPEDDDYLIFYTNSDKIMRFAVNDGSWAEREITYNNQDKVIKDIASYANRLYILDSKNNQIFRHQPTASGYGQGQPWVTAELDLQDANALAIDGSIYVLKNSGEVWKMTQGSQVDFSLDQIDPAFSNPTRLYTSPDLKNIYILDPENNRLVVFDKEGKIQNQYRSDKFDGLKDAVVDEANNTIYILNKTFVYQIDTNPDQ